MTGHPLTPLCDTLRPHFDLGKTRLETLSTIMSGMCSELHISDAWIVNIANFRSN